MKVKEGYNGRPLRIHTSPKNDGNAELWIEIGIPHFAKDQIMEEYVKLKHDTETLSYISLNEMIELRDNLNETIKAVAGV